FDGVMHYFTNTAGAGNTANFTLTGPNYQDGTGAVIDVGLLAAPYFIDLDNDADLDLVVGEGNGNINYYENTGDALVPSFTLVTDTLGGIAALLAGGEIESSVPRLFKNALGETQMFVGTNTGKIKHFANIDGNLTGVFTELDSMVTGENQGPTTVPAIYDINSDGKLDLIVGTKRGGVIYYQGDDLIIGVRELEQLDVQIYPNPGHDEVYIKTASNKVGTYVVYSIDGSLVLKGILSPNQTVMNVSTLNQGVYLLELSIDHLQIMKRLVIN
ncbi:MAG: T9SS type A sorting domain-containing protein, partial [Flavobacteriales bacterium]|nr:T9SS type A sorting domain-containing protein [Flavobacteriales bacterium]